MPALPMMKLSKRLAAVVRSRDGMTAVQYSLLAALVALAIVSAVALLGTSLTLVFHALAGKGSAL